MDTAYNGWVKLTDDEMSDFYEGNLSTDQFYENEYVFCGKEVYRVHNSEFERVSYPTINNQWCGTLRPLDRPQYALMDLLSRRDVPIKLCLGLGGSGQCI